MLNPFPPLLQLNYAIWVSAEEAVQLTVYTLEVAPCDL